MVREKSPVDINGLPFSSLASDPNCKDVVSNCAQYQAGFCTNSAYQAWAAKNCKRHCGLCGKLTSCSDCKVVLHLTFDHLKWVTNKGLRALRAKMAPFGNGLSLCFFFVAYIIQITNTWWQSSLKNIRVQRSAPPVYFNEIISIGKKGKMVKNKILATTSISSFWVGKWLKYLDLVLILGSMGWMGI